LPAAPSSATSAAACIACECFSRRAAGFSSAVWGTRLRFQKCTSSTYFLLALPAEIAIMIVNGIRQDCCYKLFGATVPALNRAIPHYLPPAS
jgi:hypothetical protein